MVNPLAELASSIDAASGLWPAVESEDRASLVKLNDVLGRARRIIDSVQARVASEIARESRPELGAEGLAKTLGFRNPTVLLAATLGTANGEAARLVQVGEATTPRRLFSGEKAPARHPHVAAGLAAGSIGAAASSMIIAMLDRVAIRAGHAAVDEGEQMLVEQAAGLSLDQLSKLIVRAEAWLDPDGVAPREEELRAERRFHIREDRTGMLVFSGKLDPEHGAPVKTVIEAIVSAELHAAAEAVDAGVTDADAVRRTIPQMQADALTRVCEHVLGCSRTGLSLAGATVVVRMTLDDLANGTGYATIDGIAAPVSVATARRMAGSGQVIPCVFGGESEILDWGRAKRLFTPTQKLALVERDGGCAMCGVPPGQAKAHHLRWWTRHSGPTDLSNGVLLCDSCHHRIHDNGWGIRIDGVGVKAKVWFIPPIHVDAARTPRLGGRARFDFAA